MKLHLCMSGHVGDVPWTAIVARACGHSSFKGCPRCFQLGVTTNSEGEALGCVRCLGYLGEVCTQTLRINPSRPPGQPGHTFWEDGMICYSVEEDGVQVFNEQGARAIRVTEEQHRKRAQGAAVLMSDCVAQRPLPNQEEGESVQTWEERMIVCGSAQLISRRALLCACVIACVLQTVWGAATQTAKRSNNRQHQAPTQSPAQGQPPNLSCSCMCVCVYV
jgi:hypothetical protein